MIDIRNLFPELLAESEITSLVSRVSGDLLTTVRPPVDRMEGLYALGAAPREPDPDVPASFDMFAATFCARYRDEVAALFEASSLSRPQAPDLTSGFLAWLTERVQQVSVRTLVAVLHLMRDAGALPGDSSEERFFQFCLISAEPAFRDALLAAFPELDRQITVIAENSLRHLRTMLTATTSAVASGQLGRSAPLTRIEQGLGDTHARGQTVARLDFADGSKLVYKPRPMDVEHAFGEFVRRVNAATGSRLPVLEVHCAEGHGWQEYADQTDPVDDETYFRSCGQLLAVLHLLRASDMHHENVLNHRGAPVVVDAETLFSVNRRRGDARATPAEVEALSETVYTIGLLPTRLADRKHEDRSADIGFLGYQPGQEAFTTSPTLAGFGTDQVRVGLTTGAMTAPQIRPSRTARGIELTSLCAGFTTVYDWATVHRTTVEQWLRELFPALAIRSVLDATHKYYKLLQTGTHPTFQQSRPLKEIFYHRVGLGRVEHVTEPVVRAEIEDLLAGDIPYFTLRTDETSVFGSDGRAVADVLEEAPLEATIAALDRLSPRDRETNLRIIRATYVDKTEPACDAPSYPVTFTGDHRAAIHQIVDRIANDLHGHVLDRRPPTWIGATIRNSALTYPWRVDGLGDDLYAGAPGVALFLAAAGVLLDDKRYRTLAVEVLEPRVAALLADPVERRKQLSGGLAGGYPGLAFALVETGRLLGSADLAGQGFALWDHLDQEVGALAEHDLMMGSAGILAGAMTLQETRVELGLAPERGAAVMRATAGHLLAHTDLRPPEPDRRLYSGFAHGTSGALATLTRYREHDPSVAAAVTALTAVHEGLFDHEYGHWPISNTDPDRMAHGWCHGTPGVLLGVLERTAAGERITHEFSDPGFLARQMSATCFELNLSLCHGDVGNLLILDQAVPTDPSGALADEVVARRGALLRQLPEMLEARTGKTTLNDSLYVGSAGIGYGLVALAGLPVTSPLTLRRHSATVD